MGFLSCILVQIQTPEIGFEPTTPRLGTLCSIQAELPGHNFKKHVGFKKPMIVKILGVLDLLAAFLIFALSFGIGIPHWIIIIFIIILLAKGAFIFTGSIASVFDILAGVILIFGLFFALPQWIFFIPGILVLQKGILSLL